MRAQSLALKAACLVALVTVVGCGSETTDGGNQPAAGASGDMLASGGTSGEAGAGAGGAGAGGEAGMGTVSGGAGGVAGETAGVGGEVTGGMGAETGGTGGMAGTDGEDFPDPRNGCPELDTNFPGDEACIAPPPAGEGIQIHIGPADYANPGNWIVNMGEENSWCANFHLPNTEEVFYQGYVLSGRPGTHHIINTAYVDTVVLVDGELGTICMDGGTGSAPNIYDNLPGASKAYMPRKKSAPENEGIGRMLPPNLPAQADMHYFNFTDQTLLREFWLNLYYIPKDQVKERAQQIRGMGGLDWTLFPIAPGTNKVYQYECAVPADGRIVSLLGHYHAHGVRFSAFLTPADGSGQKKVFEMYDYNEPAEFQYDSVSINPAFSSSAPGAISGALPVKAGDKLQWECHIINNDDFGLNYSNQVKNGEMCNLWGGSVLAGDPKINCVLFGETPFTVTAQ